MDLATVTFNKGMSNDARNAALAAGQADLSVATGQSLVHLWPLTDEDRADPVDTGLAVRRIGHPLRRPPRFPIPRKSDPDKAVRILTDRASRSYQSREDDPAGDIAERGRLFPQFPLQRPGRRPPRFRDAHDRSKVSRGFALVAVAAPKVVFAVFAIPTGEEAVEARFAGRRAEPTTACRTDRGFEKALTRHPGTAPHGRRELAGAARADRPGPRADDIALLRAGEDLLRRNPTDTPGDRDETSDDRTARLVDEIAAERVRLAADRPAYPKCRALGSTAVLQAALGHADMAMAALERISPAAGADPALSPSPPPPARLYTPRP